MRCTILLFVSLFCGLILAQDGGNPPETEITSETQSCFPHKCDLLKEFGALREKLGVMETRLKDSENQILELKKKGIFAAPVPGLYYFTFYYHAGGSHPVSLVLIKNSQSVVTAYDHQTLSDGADNGGNAVFMQLQQGDQDNATGATETEETGETKSSCPDMHDLLIEFGAMREKLTSVETRLKESENQILEQRNKGIFNAPVAGVYYFTIFYTAGGNREGKLFLYKNNDLVVMTSDHITQYDGADNGGNAVFLQLQQRDQVYVRMAANSHVWGNDYYTTFSGFLVTQ
ncbi:hypothetical protein FQN60_006330, partial [Etheostoma spectabile]